MTGLRPSTTQFSVAGYERKTKAIGGSADAGIKAQHRQLGNSLATDQRAGQVDGIQRTDRLGRKRSTSPFHNLVIQPKQCPSRRDRIQPRLPIVGVGFVQFVEEHRSNQHAVTLNQREIGGDDELRVRERVGRQLASVLLQQPRQDGARLHVELHRVPRSSSNKRATDGGFRRSRGNSR